MALPMPRDEPVTIATRSWSGSGDGLCGLEFDAAIDERTDAEEQSDVFIYVGALVGKYEFSAMIFINYFNYYCDFINN